MMLSKLKTVWGVALVCLFQSVSGFVVKREGFTSTLVSTNEKRYRHPKLYGTAVNDDDNSDGGGKKKKLVIWDCDGVLVDSEALLKQGEVEALAKDGIDVTVEDCVRLFSGVSPDKATINFEREMKQKLPDNFFKEQIAGSMDLFRARLQPLMYDTVKDVSEKNILQCIASGSPKDRVELCVDVAGMRPFFPTKNVYTRELVNKGKPAPDLFLYTAEQMGYTPEECIVIEDSSSGIRAAQAANMEVLAFLGGGHAKADWYVEDILSYNIPTVYTQKDVFNWISSKIQP